MSVISFITAILASTEELNGGTVGPQSITAFLASNQAKGRSLPVENEVCASGLNSPADCVVPQVDRPRGIILSLQI